MIISGRVVKVCDVETVSDKFAKKEIVVDTSSGTDRRENPVVVEFRRTTYDGKTNDRIALLDGVRVSDEVEIEVNVRGRRWQPKNGGDERFFVSLDGWKLTKAEAFAGADAPF